MDGKREQASLRILLIEDDPHDRELFRSALEESDVSYSITECADAEEAITVIETSEAQFDLVVSDYNLPGMTGLQLFKEVDEEQRTFPFVLLTGAGSENRAILALKSGVDDYLVKDASHRYVERLPLVLRQIVRKHSERATQKVAEETLRQSHNMLEIHVQQRTAELHKANVALRDQLNKRKEIELQLQRSEVKYRHMFDHAIEGMFQTTTTGTFLAANPALAHMLGYASPEELLTLVTDVGQQIYADPQQRKDILQQLQGQIAIRRAQVQLQRKDGTTLWAAMNIRAVQEVSGAVLYYEGTVVDISEERENSRKTAELIARINNELRGPLMVISSALESLRRDQTGSLPREAQDLVDVAARNAAQVLRYLEVLDPGDTTQ